MSANALKAVAGLIGWHAAIAAVVVAASATTAVAQSSATPGVQSWPGPVDIPQAARKVHEDKEGQLEGIAKFKKQRRDLYAAVTLTRSQLFLLQRGAPNYSDGPFESPFGGWTLWTLAPPDREVGNWKVADKKWVYVGGPDSLKGIVRDKDKTFMEAVDDDRYVKFQFVLSKGDEHRLALFSEAVFKLHPQYIDKLVNNEGDQVADEVKKLK